MEVRTDRCCGWAIALLSDKAFNNQEGIPMKIAVCYKYVPEEEEIQVQGDRTLDLSKAQWKIGQYDLNAVEAGMQLVEAAGGEVVALTAADEIADNSKLKKSILSRGPSMMYAIKDNAIQGADSRATARVLKSGIEKIGDVELVLCGEGSGDIYAQQTGLMLGYALGWPAVNAVSKLSVQEDKLIAERSLEQGVEVLEISLPAVVSVTSDINVPRIPPMRDILGAGKKPSACWSLAEVGAEVENGTHIQSVLAPEQTDRLHIILEDDSKESIDALYQYLRKLV